MPIKRDVFAPLFFVIDHRFRSTRERSLIYPYYKTSDMNTKKIWANFSVRDLERTTHFYQKLGFRSNGASDQLTSFFFGDENFIIHFFLKTSLEEGMKGPVIDTQSGNEIIFTLSADTKQDVDEWAKEVKDAGGTIVSRPEEFGEGYYGFVFADPDGHKFNVFYM
jgi:predicted lactoylglutathione lyase